MILNCIPRAAIKHKKFVGINNHGGPHQGRHWPDFKNDGEAAGWITKTNNLILKVAKTQKNHCQLEKYLGQLT